MKNNNYAYANIAGVILWSDAYKQKNNLYLHKYIVSVENNGKKNNFHVTSFNEKSSKPLFSKGDLVKVSGSLKVNSYQNNKGEWVNQPYISINKIENTE